MHIPRLGDVYIFIRRDYYSLSISIETLRISDELPSYLKFNLSMDILSSRLIGSYVHAAQKIAKRHLWRRSRYCVRPPSSTFTIDHSELWGSQRIHLASECTTGRSIPKDNARKPVLIFMIPAKNTATRRRVACLSGSNGATTLTLQYRSLLPFMYNRRNG